MAHLLKRSQIQDVLENALPAGSDAGATLSNTLRKLLSATRSAKTVQKTLEAIATLSPHSMQVERMVSHHNTILQDRRSCMVEETVNTLACSTQWKKRALALDSRPIAKAIKLLKNNFNEFRSADCSAAR